MDKISKNDSPLMRQYKQWAKSLLKVNPRYVTNPKDIVWYIKGPNWKDPDVEYAHYRLTVSLYGDELLKEFERIRSLPNEEAWSAYAELMKAAGITEKDGE